MKPLRFHPVGTTSLPSLLKGALRLHARALARWMSRASVILYCLGNAGCGVTQSVSVQTIDATSPVAAPPIHITDNAASQQFTITPHFSWPSKKNVTGILELNESHTSYTPRHDTTSYLWRIPRMTGGVNIDYAVSRHFAFGFGLGLSSLGRRTYGSWTAGFGVFNEKENGAVRFDFGLQSTPVVYSTVTRIIRTYSDRPGDTTFYFDDGRDNHINFYGALTMNTTRKAWPVNLFLNTYITKQGVVDYSPHTALMFFSTDMDTHVTASHWIVGLTPGLYVTMMEDMRLVLGERIIFPFDILDQSPYPIFQFHMQIDVTL